MLSNNNDHNNDNSDDNNNDDNLLIDRTIQNDLIVKSSNSICLATTKHTNILIGPYKTI